jgi:hypothetical protein
MTLDRTCSRLSFGCWLTMVGALRHLDLGSSRIARMDPPTSSSLAEGRTPPLPSPQHGGRAIFRRSRPYDGRILALGRAAIREHLGAGDRAGK